MFYHTVDTPSVAPTPSPDNISAEDTQWAYTFIKEAFEVESSSMRQAFMQERESLKMAFEVEKNTLREAFTKELAELTLANKLVMTQITEGMSQLKAAADSARPSQTLIKKIQEEVSRQVAGGNTPKAKGVKLGSLKDLGNYINTSSDA